MAKRRKQQYKPVSLWPAGEDLPLFSGIPITIRLAPFRIRRGDAPGHQLRFDGFYSPVTLAMLAKTPSIFILPELGGPRGTKEQPALF